MSTVNGADNVYERYRQQVEHENVLYHKLVTKLVTGNALVFAGAAVLIRGLLESQSGSHVTLLALIGVACFTAIVFSLMLQRAMNHNRRALEKLRQAWDNLITDQRSFGAVAYPHPSGVAGHLPGGVYVSTDYLPNLYIVFWLATAVIVAVYFVHVGIKV